MQRGEDRGRGRQQGAGPTCNGLGGVRGRGLMKREELEAGPRGSVRWGGEVSGP